MPDAIISEITVILDYRYSEDARTKEAVVVLESHGMRVENVNYDQSIVDGTIEQEKVHVLQQLDCVDYVRTSFTYYADYPAGDPRDRDSAGG